MGKDNSTQSQQLPFEEPPKKLKSSSVEPTKYDSDILKSQYAIAVDLYKHEDNLNWNKLNNFFYVTSALLFILGFFLSSSDTFSNDLQPRILGLLGAVGILVSISFAIAIRSGITYLLTRKASVVELEEKLKKLGGISIVGVTGLPDQQKKILKVSPTTIILKFIPLVFATGWFLLLLYNLVQLL